MSRRADEPADGDRDNKRPRPDGPGMNAADIRAQIAAKKAIVEARLAANGLSKPVNSNSNNNAPTPSAGTSNSSTAPKANPASIASTASPAATTSRPAGPAALPPKPVMDEAMQARIAAAKARIDAHKSRSSNPYLSGSGSMPKPEPAVATPRPNNAGVSSVALHPLLMGGQQQQQQEQPTSRASEKMAMRDRYKPMAPKYSSIKANANAAPSGSSSSSPAPVSTVINPYTSIPNANNTNSDEPTASARRSRKLNFGAQGKWIKQGDELRADAKMEALKQRIAAQSKKAGLDNEFDTLERSLKRQPPPVVEWWDEGIMPEGSTYDDINKALESITMDGHPLVNHLIQHPIPIPAPGDRKQEERDLMLTKKEQKKMRRQRRKAELQDKQDRQKMGLIPPDAPKVKLANLMKVLTSDAVQDPTKVEAKVRREVQNRADKHVQDNEDRKLTPEQRKEKEYQKMLAKERKGIFATVYKIKYLTNGRHKYKVRETTKKDHLSGVSIFHPDFALVLVEGTDKGIKHYKQLMLHRIDWTEQARPRAEGEDDAEGKDADGDEDGEDEDGDEKNDLADNKCELIWEGEVSERTFKGFRARHSESDTSAKEWLTPRWEGMWDLSKRWIWSGEDL